MVGIHYVTLFVLMCLQTYFSNGGVILSKEADLVC